MNLKIWWPWWLTWNPYLWFNCDWCFFYFFFNFLRGNYFNIGYSLHLLHFLSCEYVIWMTFEKFEFALQTLNDYEEVASTIINPGYKPHGQLGWFILCFAVFSSLCILSLYIISLTFHFLECSELQICFCQNMSTLMQCIEVSSMCWTSNQSSSSVHHKRTSRATLLCSPPYCLLEGK